MPEHGFTGRCLTTTNAIHTIHVINTAVAVPITATVAKSTLLKSIIGENESIVMMYSIQYVEMRASRIDINSVDLLNISNEYNFRSIASVNYFFTKVDI